MVKLIPADQVEACEAWKIPVLESADDIIVASARNQGRKSREAKLSVAPLTAPCIESLRQKACQEGFDQGHKEGYKKGMQKAQVETNETLAHLNRMISQLMHPFSEQRDELEQALVHLASGIAKSVVKMEVEFDVEILLDLVGQAVSQLPEGSDNIQIMVHPRDAELIKRATPERTSDWKIIADASLASGGCIVKTDFSYIDYTLDRQFQLTTEQMLAERLEERNKTHPEQHPDRSGR